MTTSAENGNVLTLRVVAASATVVAVAGEQSFTISRTASEIDTDTKGDTATPNMPSRLKVKCSVSALYVHTDTAVARLLTMMNSNSQVTIKMYRSGTNYLAATATITSLQIVHKDKEAATLAAEFAIDGNFA